MSNIRDRYARLTVNLEPEYIEQMLDKYKDSIEIKPSPIHGQGVFATQDIKKGGIFKAWNTELFMKMNDLAYSYSYSYSHPGNLDKQNYSSDNNLDAHINVAILINNKEVNQIAMMFGYEYDKSMLGHYFIALKDISKGEELSRVYGQAFWEEYEFFERYPDNKYRETMKDDDLPPSYVFIDTLRPGIQYNWNCNLYGKKIDDKYYYAYGFCNQKVDLPLDKLTDTSKEDNSMYNDNEPFLTNHGLPCFRSRYLAKHRNDSNEISNEIDETLKADGCVGIIKNTNGSISYHSAK